MDSETIKRHHEMNPALIYMQKVRRNTVIACEEMDFLWERKEVREFRKLWKRGFSLYYMAQHFERDIDEVFMLVLDQSKKGMIDPRSFDSLFREVM